MWQGCCSSAPANLKTSALTLDFGQDFSYLDVRLPTTVSGQAMASVRKKAIAALAAGEAGAGGNSRYALLRQGQANDARNLLRVLDSFQ